MIVATAGHVDHGKTLLVRALTGIDTDRLADEKRRGLTIDLGFAYQHEDDCTLGFVDVPGHVRFISNMLAGVGGIDCALVVVAADDGPMPQTVEHLAILHLLGIRTGVIAITKCDRVEPARVEEVLRETERLLAGTPLAQAPLVPVSAVTGDGIPELRAHLTTMARDNATRAATGYFRLAVDRCFTLTGAGVIVTGSVFAGRVHVGDELLLSPAGIPVRVRRIHAQDRESESGQSGDRCALNITGADVHKDAIHRGDWILDPALHAPTRRFDARIEVLAAEARPLAHGTPVRVHTAASHAGARLALLEERSIAPGHAGLAQLICDQDLALCTGDRFILRDQGASRTLGGGGILDPYPPRRGRARSQRLQHLRALELATPRAVLDALLDLYPAGVQVGPLFRALNLVPDDQFALLEATGARLVPLRSGDRNDALAFSAPNWTRLLDGAIESLTAWHGEHSEVLGPGERQLRNSMQPAPGPEVFALAMDELVASGRMRKTGAMLHVPGHSARLTPSESNLWERTSAILARAGLRPPVVHELAATLKVPVRTLEVFLARAVQLGLLVRVVANRYFLPESVRELARMAATLAGEQPSASFTAAQFRDRSGIGRNLAIEVLEYFDRRGFTRRAGDQRTIARATEDVL